MSESEGPFLNRNAEPEEEPLGLKEPLLPARPIGIIQRFLVPLGANPLTVLDPLLFGFGEEAQEPLSNLFQGFPFVQSSEGSAAEPMEGTGRQQVFGINRSPSSEGLPMGRDLGAEAIDATGHLTDRLQSSSDIESPPERSKGGSVDSVPAPVDFTPTSVSEDDSPLASAPLSQLDIGVGAELEGKIISEDSLSSVAAESQPTSPDRPIQPQPLSQSQSPIQSSPPPQSSDLQSTVSSEPLIDDTRPPASGIQRRIDAPSSALNASSLFPGEGEPSPRSPASSDLPGNDAGVARRSAASGSMSEAVFSREETLLPLLQAVSESRDTSNAELPSPSEPIASSIGEPLADEAKPAEAVVRSPQIPEATAPPADLQNFESEAISARRGEIERGSSAPLQGQPPAEDAESVIVPEMRVEGTPEKRVRALSSETMSQSEPTPIAVPEVIQPTAEYTISQPSARSISGESEEIAAGKEAIARPELGPANLPSEFADSPLIQQSQSSARSESKSIVSPDVPSSETSSDGTQAVAPTAKKKEIETRGKAKESLQGIFSKSIQFLSRALSSISNPTTVKPLPRSEVKLTPEDAENVGLPTRQAMQNAPSIQSAPEIPLQQSVRGGGRSPEPEPPTQVTAQSKIQSSELIKRSVQPATKTPVQRSIQVDARSSEVEAANQQFTLSQIPSETQLLESIEQLVRSEINIPIQRSIQADARSPEPEPLTQVPTQFSEPEISVQRSIAADGRSPEIETSTQSTTQPEIQSSGSIEPSVRDETDVPVSSSIPGDVRSLEADARSPEGEPQTQSETRSFEAEISGPRAVLADVRSPEIEAPLQSPELAEPSVQPEMLVQRSVSIDARSPEIETLTQFIAQPEVESSESIEQLVQTEAETPIPRSILADARSPEGEAPLQSPELAEPSVQPEMLVQRSAQLNVRSLGIEPPTQFIAQPEVESSESIEQLVQAEAETPIQGSAQLDVRSPEIEAPLQSPELTEPSTQSEMLVQRSVSTDARSPEIETLTQFIAQPEVESSESNEQFVQTEAETPISSSIPADARSLDIESSIQSSEFIEPSVQAETPIQASPQAEMRSPAGDAPTQLTTQSETQSSESLEPSVRIEPEAPVQRSIQADARSFEVETPIQLTTQSEPQSYKGEIPVQRSVSGDVRSPETEPQIQPETQHLESIEQSVRPAIEVPTQRSDRTEVRSPEIETPTQFANPPEIQSSESVEQSVPVEPEIPVQRSVSGDGRSPEIVTSTQFTTQPETQTSVSTDRSTYPEPRSPEIETPTELTTPPAIQPSETLEQSVPIEAEAPIPSSVRGEVRSLEVEPSIQFSEFIESSVQAETPIQASAQAGVRSPEVETPTPTQFTTQFEPQFSETEISVQRSVQAELRSDVIESPPPLTTALETQNLESMEESARTETERAVPRSVSADARSPVGGVPTQSTIQPEIQFSESIEQSVPSAIEVPVQRFTQADVRSREIDSPTRSPEFAEPSVRPETPLPRSLPTDARSPESAPQTQSDIQSFEPEISVPRSVPAEVRSPDIETPNRPSASAKPSVWAETETPVRRTVEGELRSPEGETPTQFITQSETQTSGSIEPSAQPESRSPEIETLTQLTNQLEPEIPAQRSVRTDARSPAMENQTQPAIQLSESNEPSVRDDVETPVRRSIEGESRSPEVETPTQFATQPETQPSIPIWRSTRSEAPLPEIEVPTQFTTQPDTPFSQPDLHLQNSVQADVRFPEVEAPIQFITQIEPEIPAQRSVSTDVRSPEIEVPTQFTTQSETQASGSIEQSVRPATEVPTQQSVPTVARSPEGEAPIQSPELAEPSVRSETELAVQRWTEGKAQSIESNPAIESIGRDLPNEFLQTSQQLQNSSESETGDSSPTLITAQTSQKFPPLPRILQNISILQPLVPATSIDKLETLKPQQYASPLPDTPEQATLQKSSDVSAKTSQIEESAIAPPPPSELPPTPLIAPVRDRPTQYAKIDIPVRQRKPVEPPSHPATLAPLTASNAESLLQRKRDNRAAVIQRVKSPTVIFDDPEEEPRESEGSALDRDIETLAHIVYKQLQQRLRIDRERYGHGTGRFPW
ncbi:hypothetical protein [Altericista sp. CCNU0014]|uniref:hypothetical protein n=1 Tax=Altericista sp. CCNU0014 TaxID=3082949 RepID=UPI00384BEB13